jgi:predicted regulator of Ras-like GTPase activity (Roadblock/LC7/MglB family)
MATLKKKLMYLLDSAQSVLNISELSSEQKEEIKKILTLFSDEHEGLTGVVLTTLDGYPIASHCKDNNHVHLERLSIWIKSTLSVLAGILDEIEGGQQRVMFLESESRNIIIYMIPHYKVRLVLTAAFFNDSNMAKLNWHIRQLSSLIIDVIDEGEVSDNKS